MTETLSGGSRPNSYYLSLSTILSSVEDAAERGDNNAGSPSEFKADEILESSLNLGRLSYHVTGIITRYGLFRGVRFGSRLCTTTSMFLVGYIDAPLLQTFRLFVT